MPVVIIIIDKTGCVKSQVMKDYKESELYKKAGFKNADGFVLQTTWLPAAISRDYSVSVYAKKTGRSGQENKYDFPPPIDKDLFFGSCVLVAHTTNGSDTNEIVDLTIPEWNSIYEHLFGGFEDIGDEDSELSDEDEDISDIDAVLTKSGYVKDGCIVDDDESDPSDESDAAETDSDENDSDDASETSNKKKKSKVVLKKRLVKSKPKSKDSSKLQNIFIKMVDPKSNEVVDDVYLDCTSELSEEAYL